MSELDETLDRIRSSDEIIGCAVVTRDGLPAAMRFSKAHDPDTLSAMTAATLAAAETALLGIDSDVDCVVIQGSKSRTVIQGMDTQHLFVIIAEQQVSIDELLKHSTQAIESLRVHAE